MHERWQEAGFEPRERTSASSDTKGRREVKNIKDKVAVVTGAASGIGRATAIELARRGMHVALADVDEAGIREARRDIEALGRRCAHRVTDVRHKAELEALLDHTLRDLGACHVVFNNAGVAHVAPFLETSDEQWQRLIDIDLWGVVHGSRVFGAHFAARGEGHIVNTASGAGLYGVPGLSAYVTAKFGVVGLSEAIRFELAEHGIGVTVVCPGVVRTGIAQAEGFGPERIAKLAKLGASPEGLAKKIARAIERDEPVVLYGRESYVLSMVKRLPFVHDRAGKLLAAQTLRQLRQR